MMRQMQEDARFDDLITAIEQHIEPQRHPAVRELVRLYKADLAAARAAHTDVSDATYRQRVQAVFARLRASEGPDVNVPIAQLVELDARVGDLVFARVEDIRAELQWLSTQESVLERYTVFATYFSGRLFHLAKCRHRSTNAVIRSLNLNLSRQDVERKIQVYDLLQTFPRLRRCHVPASFMLQNATLIENEARYLPDAATWKN